MTEPAGEELARQCAALMWESDRASRDLGMRLDDVGTGRARVAMQVQERMVNGHGLCHGGYVATLADSAFAFACNTYDDVTVAAGFDVVFLRPALLGDELVAEAVERTRTARSGLYDVRVSRWSAERGSQVVAEMRGRSRSLGRPILGAADPD